ncbi:winged helix-turn-helix transcriptional regulator [Sunxiuqinia elliptica]|nr:winged helix-turn-helix transcriptional regulator [Sunxiuqinia elliptica]
MKGLNGFIKIHRKMLDWELIKDVNATYIFLQLLLSASYYKSKKFGIELAPGQLFITTKQLSERTGLSVQQIKTAMNKLVQTGTIIKETTTKATTNKSLITICNWYNYQGVNTWNQTQQQQRLQTKSPPIINSYKKLKKKKEEKEERGKGFFDGISNNNLKFKNYEK